MTEEEPIEVVRLHELVEFLDQICPEDTAEESGPKKRVTRARFMLTSPFFGLSTDHRPRKSDESNAKKKSKCVPYSRRSVDLAI
jgi:hypothetical protein